MSIIRLNSNFRIWLLIILGIAVALAVWCVFEIPKAKDRRAERAFNRLRVESVAMALRQFQAIYNRCPTNLSELKTNRQGFIFYDQPLEDLYKRPFLYEPLNSSAQCRIGSFGADGRPGGSKADEDFFVDLK